MNAERAGGRVPDADEVLRGTAEPVLRAEQRREFDPARDEQVRRVAKLRVDRRGVAQQSDAPAAQRREAGVAQNVESGAHGLLVGDTQGGSPV